MIIENKAQCSNCEEIIFSKHRHDYVTCSCGAISVDGGQEYLRRGGTALVRGTYTDLSWELPDVLYKACAEAVEDARETNRNKFGISNAVLRKLREAGRIVADGEYRVFANYEDELMVEEPDGTVNRYTKVCRTRDGAGDSGQMSLALLPIALDLTDDCVQYKRALEMIANPGEMWQWISPETIAKIALEDRK